MLRRPMLRSRTTALTLALALVWLAIGYANVARGAAHAGAGYRFWAFQHHCYSDVIALHGDRYLGGGRPLPYLEDRIEYPVLLGVALWAASFAPGGALGHFTATYLFLSACLVVALLALAFKVTVGAIHLLVLAAIVLYVVGFLRGRTRSSTVLRRGAGPEAAGVRPAGSAKIRR